MLKALIILFHDKLINIDKSKKIDKIAYLNLSTILGEIVFL